MVQKGSDLMLFYGGRSIAAATSCSFNMSMDTKESSNKDSGGVWQSMEAGIISWDMSSENMFTVDGDNGLGYNDIFDLMTARQSVEIVFALKQDSGNETFEVGEGGWKADTTSDNGQKIYRKGSALITSLQANAPNGDNATFSVTFQGNGPLSKYSK
jgi:predicted secreted protein